MALGEAELMVFLEELGIETATKRHPAVFTVAESQVLRDEIPGAHTKNLFLKDRKDAYFLLTVAEDAVVDLKTVHTVIGAQGKVSFGKPDALQELLGVTPGSVTAFGIVNDTQKRVKMVFDAGLMRADLINGHPLTNEATTTIARSDLLRFVEATGHEAHVLNIATPHTT
ncbi:MAG TPA: YbaK/EbsC family protein [Rhizobiaceae bacterium]|nr:YbaK/EbsC family protein [Rhizobiaceae bacterium]